jgi:uncharacterized protein (TIGR03000 family)
MTPRKNLYSLAGGLVLLVIPFQSLALGKLGDRFGKKKNDCATGSVAPSAGGCCMDQEVGGSCGACGECSSGGECGCASMILEPNAVYLTVNVPEITLDCPEDAVLTVNGDPTATKGASRSFIVRNLEPGKEYEFKLAAITKNRGGVELMQKETIKLQVGDMHTVTMKPVRRKADIERQEAEQAAQDAEEADDSAGDGYENEPEDIDAVEPVAMAFPFSLD